MFAGIIERFLTIRRVPVKFVIITALASYVLQVGAIIQGQPLYIIALYTLLPWIPLLFFESTWKIKHYNWIAIFAIITALQIGHLGEHVAQVGQLFVLNGVISQACPPPLDNLEHAQAAEDFGLRPAGVAPTNAFASRIVIPDEDGLPNEAGEVGPPACGVFGALDAEAVHLIWDSLVWIGALYLLTKFSGNAWLWVAVAAASIHQVEHNFLGWIFYVGGPEEFAWTRQLWATTADGHIVTAHPVGQALEIGTFYEAGGAIGILGNGGLVENLLRPNRTTDIFPSRAVLHFGYNVLVVVPTTIAFLVQARRVYDEFLAQALPELSEDQLIAATPKLVPEKFRAGEVIIRQGDPADMFFILTKGEAEVVREHADGDETVVNRLSSGQYFGEIGLMHGGKRMATIRAASDLEVLALDRSAFSSLIAESEISRDELNRLARQRLMQVKAIQSSD